MEVRIVYKDDCGSSVTYNDVKEIAQYNDEIVLRFCSFSQYIKSRGIEHCILYKNRIRHLKVLYD